MRGYESDRMLTGEVKLNRMFDSKMQTAKLNKVIGYLAERTPRPSVGWKRFRVYYATQTGNRPFRIRLFCNREEKLTEQYRRYLEAGLVDETDLKGCPQYFYLVGQGRHAERTVRNTDAAPARTPHRTDWQTDRRRESA